MNPVDGAVQGECAVIVKDSVRSRNEGTPRSEGSRDLLVVTAVGGDGGNRNLSKRNHDDPSRSDFPGFPRILTESASV